LAIGAAPSSLNIALYTSTPESFGPNLFKEQLGVDQPSKLGPGIRALAVLDATHAWAVRLPPTPSDSLAH